MGLAASQARFLAITARKADCEMRSMQIAQDKLSITNELTKASEQYQSVLNTSRLLWDSDGTGAYTYDVSYDLLMTPSAANYYDPYLVTTTDGKIALNSELAAAAVAAGLNPNGGSARTDAARNAFINALAGSELAPSTAAELVAQPYSKNAGVGGRPLDKTTASAVSNGTLAQVLSDSSYAVDFSSVSIAERTGSDWSSYLNLYLNASSDAETSNRNITIGDFMEDDYTLVYEGLDDSSCSTGSNNLKEFLSGVFGDSNSKLQDNNSVFGKMAKMLTNLLGIDENSLEALDYAYKKVMQMYAREDAAVSAGTPSSTKSSRSDSIKKASEYNAVCYTDHDDLNDKENSHIAVNLSNLLSVFLTCYAQQLNTSNYAVTRIEDNSYFVTDDMTFLYNLKNTNAVTEREQLMADFYNSLFNNICTNGWTGAYQNYLDDADYLQNALKNGQLFIATLNNDGYYHQDVYNDNGYIVEVTDDDAIAQAELEYEITKSKLNYKEEQLDIDMKNVDMEISSLSTEYDTVKNLISKNVEKIFTMFQSS